MGATFSRIKSWISGETLTHTDLNAEFNNILTNLTPAGMDDQSTNDAAMQNTVDPYPSSVIDKPTDLKGEIERLRYVIKQITGETNWYIDPDATLATTGDLTKANFTTPGQFTSSVATGTAPLVVSSTTEVANLLAATATKVTDGTNNIHIKIMEIGNWDMTNVGGSSSTKTVAHGLTYTKIRSVSAMVRHDNGELSGFQYMLDAAYGITGQVNGGVSSVDATNITLRAEYGGLFDNDAFNNASSYNRGWVTITYVD